MPKLHKRYHLSIGISNSEMSSGKNSTLRFSFSVLLFVIYGLFFVGCRSSEHEIEKYILQMAATGANDRASAVKHLKEIGAPAVPNLILALDSQDLAVRANVVWLLGEIGEPVEKIVPFLIRAFADSDQNVRTIALLSIISIGNPTVPFLIDVFGHPNAGVRQQAAFALGEIGQPINLIIPALIGNLDDSEWNVRRVSVRALLNIGQPAEPQLIEALNNGNRETRRTARIALDQMAHRKR